MSHAGYLRDFWGGDVEPLLAWIRAVHAAGEAGAPLGEAEAVALVDAVDGSVLADGDAAIVRFVTRQTLAPRAMTAAGVQGLRDAGFDDRAIHDVVQVGCCFSYMNRLADALGVVIEERKEPFAQALFGEAALAAHYAWGRGQEPSGS